MKNTSNEQKARTYQQCSANVAERNRNNFLNSLDDDPKSYKWMHDHLYRLGIRIGLPYYHVEDVMQNFYLVLCQRGFRTYDGKISANFSFLGRNHEGKDVWKYLATSFVNLGKDRFRKIQRDSKMVLESRMETEGTDEKYSLDMEAATEQDMDSQMENLKRRTEFEQYMAELQPNHREIISLAYFQQFSYKQMEVILDIPIGTVKSRLHTAVASLADIIEKATGKNKIASSAGYETVDNL